VIIKALASVIIMSFISFYINLVSRTWSEFTWFETTVMQCIIHVPTVWYFILKSHHLYSVSYHLHAKPCNKNVDIKFSAHDAFPVYIQLICVQFMFN
jgi:hypothetical protein